MDAIVFECAQQLGEALAGSTALQRLRDAEAAAKLDGQAQDLLEKAEEVRKEIRTALQNGKQPSELQDMIAALQEVNAQTSANATLSELAAAKEAFQAMWRSVQAVLQYHMGEGDGSDCGGECGSCSGCG